MTIAGTAARHLRPRAWIAPIAVVTLLMSLLATMYLAYVVNPAKNLHDFPVALVNQDDGDTLGGKPTNVGNQITDALVANLPTDKIDLRVVGFAEAQRQLSQGKVYGAIVIPSDFTKRLAILGAAGVVPGKVEQPIITVHTNPRAGSFATGVMQRIADQALTRVDETVGKQLTDTVQTQLQPAGGGQAPQLAGASQLMLAHPIQVVVDPYRPLPDGTGQGLSAFFYTIMVLLAGFTGAMIIHAMTDSALGFAPTEYGPWYVHYPTAPISRFRTLLLKWAILIVTAPIVSAVFLGVAAALDVPLDHPLALFLYCVLAIIAVGVTALSVLAALGTAGLLVNLILFIVLGLPSSGGSVPIEATPAYFEWLATFEPMHQVFLGLRAILYFNANSAAGLARGSWMAVLGLGIGLVVGAVVTVYYDRKGLHRKPAEQAAATK
ncbi:SNG1 family protein [Nocardia vinacea]|uniref:YhgE/Pip domain-containing protein n=1 Tax=Nocardia vinacea TaxID=96468 RepID=UPI002E111285|nr:SNG1 family protein [Nocardia vinacea]